VVPVILFVTIEPAPPAAPLLMDTAPAKTPALSLLPAITATLLVAVTSAPPVILAVTLVPIRLVATEPARPICDEIAIPTATVEMLAFELALTATLPDAVSLEPVTPALTLLAMLL
jgi:hypothetical protein